QYWIIGLSSIPAGIVGFLLIQRGMTQRNAIIISLLIVACLSVVIWFVVKRRIFADPPVVHFTVSVFNTGADLQIQPSSMGLVGSVPLAVIFILTTPAPNPSFKITLADAQSNTAPKCKIVSLEV